MRRSVAACPSSSPLAGARSYAGARAARSGTRPRAGRGRRARPRDRRGRRHRHLRQPPALAGPDRRRARRALADLRASPRQVDVVRDLRRRADPLPAPRDGGADRHRRGPAAEPALGPLHARVRGRRAAGAARPAAPGPRRHRPGPLAPGPRRGRGLREGVPRAHRAQRRAAEGAADGPVGDRRRRQPARRRDPLAGAPGPAAPGSDLSDEELDALRRVTRKVIRDAIRLGGAHTGELNPHRVRGGRCPRCGTALERDRIGGRTTYWCPKEQVVP